MELLALECDVFIKRLDIINSLNKPSKDYIGLVYTRLSENQNKQNILNQQQARISNSRERQQFYTKPQVRSAYSVDQLKERSQKGNQEQGQQMIIRRSEIMNEKQQQMEIERQIQIHQSPYESAHKYKQYQQREQQQLKEQNEQQIYGFNDERIKNQNRFEGQQFLTPKENQLRKRDKSAGSGNKQEQGQVAWIQANKNILTSNYSENRNGSEKNERNLTNEQQYILPSNVQRELQNFPKQTEGLKERGQRQNIREQQADKDYLNVLNQGQGNNAFQKNIKKMEQSEEKISANIERNYWDKSNRDNNSSKKEANYRNVKQEALIVKKEEGLEQEQDILIQNYNNPQSNPQRLVREWSDLEVKQLTIILNKESILVEDPQLSFQKITIAFNSAISQLENKHNINNSKLFKRTQEEIVNKLRADAKVVYQNERKKQDSIYKTLMEKSRTTK